MQSLQISIIDPNGNAMPDVLDELRQDIEHHVAPVDFAPESAPPGSRGPEIDVTTLVLGVLSSTAVGALIDVLKAYVERGRMKLVFKGPGGEVTIDTRDVRTARAEIKQAVEQAGGH